MNQAVGLEMNGWHRLPRASTGLASLRRVSPWAGMNDAVGVGIETSGRYEEAVGLNKVDERGF